MRQIQKYISTIVIFCLVLISQSTGVVAGENKAMPWIPLLLFDDTVTITISGKATIPNYTPSGKLVVFVDGLDGEIYGAALSDKDGNYFVKADVPKDLQRVLVFAVDHNDPNYYTASYVSLVGEGKKFFYEREEITADLNRRKLVSFNDLGPASIAVSLVSDYTGLSESEFGEEEEMAVITIEESILQGVFQPRFCSQIKHKDKDDLLVALAKKHINHSLVNRLMEFTRKTSDNNESILIRLQNGGNDINGNITSSNWARNRVAPAGFGLLAGKFLLGPVLGGPAGLALGAIPGLSMAAYNEVKVTKVRNMIDSFSFSSLNEQSTGWTTQEHLEAAVSLIYHHGFGNCEEKGLVAAYFASLFDTDEFKQVAHVVATTGKHSWYGSAKHSFAIACTEDKSVYDLQNLPSTKIINKRVSLPQAFYNAGCYLVDPWAQNMAELTMTEADSQEWEQIQYVMGVYNRNQTKSLLYTQSQSEALTYFAQSTPEIQSCPVNMVCDVCSNRDDMDSRVCQAWVPLPENKPPEAHSQSVDIYENTSGTITLSGSDVDNDPLTYTIIDQPNHGALSGTAPNLTYTPAAGYNGSDSFTFIVYDGNSYSPKAMVSIHVSPMDWVVYTIDNAGCFDAIIVTVGERSKFLKEELVCQYWYYGENTCTVKASKTEMQGGFDTRADGYKWLDGLKGEWMINRWCPGNGYYELQGKPGYYMIF